jgi:RNA polymerase sigma-70 factor (ECF subfamily)
LQDTVERAISNIDSWTPGTRLDSWMYRIAHNRFLNLKRAEGTQRNYQRLQVHYETQSLDGERHAEGRLAYSQIRVLVTLLPEEQRAALLLIAVEGLSYRDAAKVLEIPEGTVTSRLARARSSLREWLENPSSQPDSAQIAQQEEMKP